MLTFVAAAVAILVPWLASKYGRALRPRLAPPAV